MTRYSYCLHVPGWRAELRRRWGRLIGPHQVRPDGQDYTGRTATVVWSHHERLPQGAIGHIVSADRQPNGQLHHEIKFPHVTLHTAIPAAEIEVDGLRLSWWQRLQIARWRRWSDRHQPPAEWSEPLGRQATITVEREGWPPAGTVCRVAGYEGLPPRRLGPLYRLRYGVDGEVWTRLPAEGVELV